MLTVSENDRPQRDPVPAKVHIAVCSGVIDIGIQKTQFKNQEKEQHKVIIIWELPYETIDTEDGPLPRQISKMYTVSLSDKATLRKHVEAWLGRKLTEAELKAFDLRTLAGQACQLQVVHVERDGKTYANINTIMSLPDNMPVPAPSQCIIYDLDAPDALETLDMLPEWIQNKIKESKTYQEKATAEERPAWPSDEDLPL